jgi:aspartate dehydrogenase
VSGRPTMKVGIAGLGAVGRAITRKLHAGAIPHTRLVAVAVRNAEKARAFLAEIGCTAPISTIAEVAAVSDLVVECAPALAFADIATAVLSAGKRLMAMSAGQLLERSELAALAERHGGQIIVPAGALLGLDAVAAAAEGHIHSVAMVTRKPVRGLLGAPFLVTHGIDIAGLTAPKRIFQGTAREAARGFPENVNVAAALSLAGIGPDRTTIEIWADPALTRNVHRVVVESDAARFEMGIENVPSENPKTGRMTAQSALACLRKLNAPLAVGT